MTSQPDNMELSGEDQSGLVELAHQSIRHGLHHGRQPPVDTAGHSLPLQAKRASFVTIKLEDNLRGCVGTLEAQYPLVLDIVKNAYAAAFSDPRFPPLTKQEYAHIKLSIALLNPSVAIECTCEEELIACLKPGIDGVSVEEGAGYHATFLPAVWQTLTDRREFIRQLKLKAGLPRDYWSPTLRFRRYTTQIIAL